MAEVIMPKMGDAMIEGKVLHWMKRPGDQVQVGEALAEIETDKVNVELTAEEGGVLTQIIVGDGGVAPVGGTIAMIGRPGEAPPAPTPSATPSPQAPPAAQAAPAPAASAAQATAAPSAPGKPAPAAPAAARAPTEERIKASPLARRMAAEQSIDLSQVEGTGPEGRITKEDLEAFIARGTGPPAAPPRPAAPPTPGAPPAAPAPPPTAPAPGIPGADVALSRMRQTIARRMSESKQQVPHFYVTVEILMDEAAKAREQMNTELGQKIVSLNDLILKAAAVALRAFPNLNATFMGEMVRRHDEIHMGFAVALPEGLIVPVIRDCDRKPIPDIARETKSLGERARSGKLHPTELQGGTFTVSNLGMFDVESFIAIINPPQAAILAVGSARAQPVADGDRVRVARVMKATISADHRVTDGAEAARYLGEFRRLLQESGQL
jgi:pyruvate dehydrogenase E2 component (dihydrolipoamide acetyltransferase)